MTDKVSPLRDGILPARSLYVCPVCGDMIRLVQDTLDPRFVTGHCRTCKRNQTLRRI